MATTTKRYDARKAFTDYYVYAPLGAGQLVIEKSRELTSKAAEFGFQQMQAAERRAWHERVEAGGEPPGIHRVEPVNVLGRLNRGNDLLVVDLARKRQLDQNAVDALVRIQLPDQVEQFRFADRIRQLVVEAGHSGFRRRPVLGANVDCACRILPDEHGREARCAPNALLEGANAFRDALTKRGGCRFAVDPFRRHPP